MKNAVLFVILLFLIPMLAHGQSLSANAPSKGASPGVRVPIEPAPLAPEPVKAPEFTFPAPKPEPCTRLLWGDIDGDGLQDLLVLDLNGNHLLKNLGNGSFEDVTEVAFPDGADRGLSGLWGDCDGDELPDLFLFHVEGFTLYRNEGRLRFTDVTVEKGLDPGLQGSAVNLDDYDGDGYADLLVKTPKGDRIFNNRDGRSFDKVNLPGVEESSGRPPADTSPRSGFTPSASNPSPYPEGHPAQGADGTSSSAKGSYFDDRYVNDCTPASCGINVPEVEGGDDAAVMNDIVDGTIAGADLEVPLTKEDLVNGALVSITNSTKDKGSVGIRGECSATGCTGVIGVGHYGVKGESEIATGVLGNSTATSGSAKGVHGISSSPDGYGVYGSASATSGECAGVYGLTASTVGYGVLGEGEKYGVYGKATSTSDWHYGVRGDCYSAKGHGVAGYALSTTGNTFGVLGRSESPDGKGVYGYAKASTGENFGVLGQSNSPDGYAVKGEALATSGNATGVAGTTAAYNGKGVYGESTTTSGTSYGVYGVNNSGVGAGVHGASPGIAVQGNSSGTSGTGVRGVCYQSGGIGVKGQGYTYGVMGSAGSSGTTYGVYGITNADNGYGVYGEAEKYGIKGYATNTSGLAYGVQAVTDSVAGWAVYGVAAATTGFTRGVYGYCASTSGYGVYGWATANSGTNYGVFGKSDSPDGYGGYFVGGTSTDTLTIRGGSDLSERFDVSSADSGPKPEPGMVVCIDPSCPGDLVVSSKKYDRTVAGIISGAGGIRTGMLMGQEGTEADGESPVALTGRVYCYADASKGSIEPGDLLTTSDIPGHAMKVTKHAKAQGAIIGKAMTSLESGRGLVLVLVSLQ